MRILLDTHVALWFISGSPRISTKRRLAIEDPANEVYLSVVSVWEAAIKHAVGKLNLPSPPAVLLPAERQRHQISSLPLEDAAVAHLHTLPPIHRDPFDRMLACQAIEHGLTLATVDSVFSQYPVALLPS
jgi:PIN domain nuclease of toxin-antitoxin system